MRKILFPSLVGIALLSAIPSYAQMPTYQDPFDTFFNNIVFQPQKLAMRPFAEPRMNMVDTGDRIEIKAELPGIDEKDIALTCENGILTLSGERKQETEENSQTYYMKEISSGSFSRSIRLPQNVDENKIEAQFKKGVLTITIPKIAIKEDTSRKIPIKIED